LGFALAQHLLAGAFEKDEASSNLANKFIANQTAEVKDPELGKQLAKHMLEKLSSDKPKKDSK